MFQPVTYSKTGVALHWTDFDLEQVAKALVIVNPRYMDWQAQADYIQLHASRMIENEPTICGTGGWYVTMFINSEGKACCKCTVMAYSILSYLKEQGVKID